VVVPKDQAVGLTPTVAKVASGAAETVPLYRVTNLARCLDRLKDAGFWIVGASGRAEKTVYGAELTGPLAVVLGAEGRGLRRLTEQKCDFLVRIPMAGTVESLNVSVAAGVLLYEAVRQRTVQSSVSGR
jgi:23S rRNA (guanosine2251-2'-O)-methyltransferase